MSTMFNLTTFFVSLSVAGFALAAGTQIGCPVFDSYMNLFVLGLRGGDVRIGSQDTWNQRKNLPMVPSH